MPLLLGLWASAGVPPNPDPTPPPPVPPVAVWPHLKGRTSWWVVNKDADGVSYVRTARLWTCRASGDVSCSLLNGIGTFSVEVSLNDPSIGALTTADGRLATTQNSGVEIQCWRDGSLLTSSSWWVVTNRDTALTDWNGTLQLANREQLLAWVNQGHANRYDWLDVDHWDPMADTAGKFDVSLSGWGTRGGATASAVTNPVKDTGTAYSAQVITPAGGLTNPDVGLVKEVPLEHSLPGGIPYRLGAWYWMPSGGTGSGFYYGAALRFRYLPPGMTVWDEFTSPTLGGIHSVHTVPDVIARGKWTYISTDLLVPPNTGGRVQALLMAAEGSPDNPGGPQIVFWSRPHIVRDDTFTAINYVRGDKVSTAGARLVAEASYAADTPYRGLQTSGAPADTATGPAVFEPLTTTPGNQRIHYRYPEAEHHNLWEIAQDLRRDGNVDAWIDCGANQAVLRFTTRGKDQDTWPLAVDGLRGRITGPSSDASKARSILGVQDKTISEFDRPEGVYISPTVANGAVVEEWTTAQTDGVNVWDEAQRVGRLRQSSPQIVQAELPGDAQADDPQAGDFHRVSVQLGGGAFMASTPTRKWRTTAVSYNEERDVFKLELADQVVS